MSERHKSPPRRARSRSTSLQRKRTSSSRSPDRSRSRSPLRRPKESSPPRRREKRDDPSPPRRGADRGDERKDRERRDESKDKHRGARDRGERGKGGRDDWGLRKRREDSPDGNYEFGKPSTGGGGGGGGEADPKLEKEKPNFGLSEQSKDGVSMRWVEPPEACKPRKKWRLYPFKGEQSFEPIPVYRKSCYVIGRDRAVVDIPADHPSCSKQHAVIQHRLMEVDAPADSFAPPAKTSKSYIVDLGSTNGTFLKNRITKEKEKIEKERYYELKEGDVLYFGLSEREYVLLHDEMIGGSKGGNDDD